MEQIIRIIARILAVVLSFSPTVEGIANENIGQAQRIYERQQYVERLDLPNATPFEEISWNFDGNDKGTLYRTNDTFVYLPNNPGSSTKYCIYYAGGMGEWIIHTDLVLYFTETYQPDAIYIMFVGSGVDDLGRCYKSTIDTIRSVAAYTNVIPDALAVMGSSVGGYTALTASAYLFREWKIPVTNIMLYDIGVNWKLEYLLPTESEANDIRDSGATVYAFGRGGEIYSLYGAKLFAQSGTPLVEVSCRSEGHDEISVQAFQRNPFLYAVGLADKLDPEEYYSIRYVNIADFWVDSWDE